MGTTTNDMGVYGGPYRRYLSVIYTNTEEFAPKVQTNFDFSIYPNPCIDLTSIEYSIYEFENVKINLFEISGVKIKSLLNENKVPGNHEISIDLSDLKPGIYFCIFKTNNPEHLGQTKKIIKL